MKSHAANLKMNVMDLKYPRSQRRPAMSPGRKTNAYYVHVGERVMGKRRTAYLNGPDPGSDARVLDGKPKKPTTKIVHSHSGGWGLRYQDSFVIRLEYLL